MIYITQLGESELGRGETIDQAIESAKEWGFELKENEIEKFNGNHAEGDVVWNDEKLDGYND